MSDVQAEEREGRTPQALMTISEDGLWMMPKSSDMAEMVFSSRWFLVLFLVIAAASAAIGMHHAFTWAFDFQWPAARLLAHGKDPWIEALQSHRNLTNSASVPNYLHELYVLYLPLTLFSEQTARIVWALANITMLLLAIRMLCTLYEIPRKQQPMLVLIMIGSISFRTGLGAGQFCFAELFLFCIIYRFHAAQVTRGLSLGLTFAKYSFSPIIALTFLLRGRMVAIAASLIPVLSALGICMWLLHKPILPLAVEPFMVARQGVSPGFADLMTLGERVFGHGFSGTIDAAALVLAVLYAVRLSRKRNLTIKVEFACISVASLLLFKHLIYDYIFLSVPFAYAFAGHSLRRGARWAILGIVAYVWFASPLYMSLENVRDKMPLLILNCSCLAALLLAIDLGAKEYPMQSIADTELLKSERMSGVGGCARPRAGRAV